MEKRLLLLTVALFTSTMFSQIIDATEIELNFSGDSYPQNFTKGVTKMYFSANDGINMEELWVYDTVTDTTHLVKDVGNGNSGLDNSKMMTIGDILYFTVNTGSQLWRSDGTEAGTYMVKLISIAPASNNTITTLFNFNGKVVFNAYDPINGKELWISDGTTTGTTLLKDIRAGAIGSNPDSFFICNGTLYFAANDGINGNEIWKSDGTPSGTVIFKNIDGTSNSSISSAFIVLNNNFYFYCYSNANGYELWKSNGTDSGTQLFIDIIPGNESSNYNLYGKATANYFIFKVQSPTIGTELWKCDGTITGTVLLKDIYTGFNSGVSDTSQFTVLNNNIYFDATTVTNGRELWVTNGTTAGTQLIKDIHPGNISSNITKLTTANNYVIFSAKSGTHTYNTPWISNGTNAGTFELKDTNLTVNSAGNLEFLEFNNKVYFGAGYNSLNGNELWATDGTTINTNLFKDIYHKFSGMTDFYDSAKLGNKLIYTGRNGTENNGGPCVTDGTVTGTRAINTGNVSLFTSAGFRGASYTKAGNYVFFRAGNSANGYEIWKTDGTDANTSIVKDIKPGNGSSISEYTLFTEFNGIFYFMADNGTHGNELWRSDGTSSGTYMVKDINVGTGHAFNGLSNLYYNSPSYLNENCFAVLNGFLYFTADDGTDNSVWKTDGTAAGTIKVITIPASGVFDNRRVVINASNNKIFFKTNTTNSSYGNNSIWSSDGTQSGTTFLYHTNITGPTQFKQNIIHNNTLYFSVYGNNGHALMKSDGTLAGTAVVIENITTQETFNSLYSCGNFVYFSIGPQGLYGKELWRTDGTTAGTLQLGDVGTTLENFIYCNTCIQNNLLFKKENLNEDKIYYVNGNSIDANSYLTTNIINGEDFGQVGYFDYSNFYNLNNKLLFAANKEYAGTELYYSDFNFSTLDIEDFENANIKSYLVVYPNPAKNSINFKVQNGETVLRASVYDLLGKRIFSSDIISNELELSGIGNGIYLLSVITDKSQYSHKIVIKK